MQWRELREYEHTPLARIQSWSQVHKGTPLFESILMFERYQLDALLKGQGEDWQNRSFRLYEQTGYPITVTVYAGDELCLQIEYDGSRFDSMTVKRMLGHLRTLLEGMLKGLYQKLAELPMLTEAERTLMAGWNDTRADLGAETLLHKLFEAQVERTPDTIAVSFEGRHLSYAALNESANRLAHRLQKLGVAPNTLVAVFMQRSMELIVALYAVLKAGGAYVPIDPEYPRERINFMIRDAATPVLLTQSALSDSLGGIQAEIVRVDGDWHSIAGEAADNPDVDMDPDNFAYMIYTSGSTGRPKGALNTHRGICNRLLWMQARYGLVEGDRVLQKTPYSFDVSVWELFWPLISGARLVVASPGGHRDPTYLFNLIEEQQITVLHFVPSMLRVFLEEERPGRCASLRRVICSGEALPFELQERFFRLHSAALENLYGPTEAAVDVTAWTCLRGDPHQMVPIGKPIANTQVHILNPRMEPVPVGVPGELYIGGVQVGGGYHNRPELTRERFIPDPFVGKDAGSGVRGAARLYKTGDLCRWFPDGNVEYLGRLDFQVKIRGFRIELGEIESVLSAHPSVRACVVSARQDAIGNPFLVAYVVPKVSGPLSVDSIRKHLRRLLPEHMVPAAFVSMPEIPLTPNGKIDRRALPAPETREIPAESRPTIPPVNNVERTILDAWREVLEVTEIGRDDNFFDIGGDSLRLMRVRAILSRSLGRELTMLDMLTYANIRSLARHICGDTAAGESSKSAAQRGREPRSPDRARMKRT